MNNGPLFAGLYLCIRETEREAPAPGRDRPRRRTLGALVRPLVGVAVLAAVAIGLAACGGDDGDATAQASAGENAASATPDVSRLLMHDGEEPGFRQGARPGQLPRSRETVTGVEAFVKDMGLAPADARRLRSEGFVSYTVQPVRGPRATAGVTSIALFATARGAEHNMTYELRRHVIRSHTPVANLRLFFEPSIPGARGWTASKPHVGNLWWVQGRCVLVLGNQGPGPFAGALSTGARAIYKRTNGTCP
jgi:hypothetical protein